jgi:hypothetical protein
VAIGEVEVRHVLPSECVEVVVERLAFVERGFLDVRLRPQQRKNHLRPRRMQVRAVGVDVEPGSRVGRYSRQAVDDITELSGVAKDSVLISNANC